MRQHPQGYGVRNRDFSSSFGDGIDFAVVVQAMGGYGERVMSAEDLPLAVQRAREAVRRGRTAVVDVLITPVGGNSK